MNGCQKYTDREWQELKYFHIFQRMIPKVWKNEKYERAFILFHQMWSSLFSLFSESVPKDAELMKRLFDGMFVICIPASGNVEVTAAFIVKKSSECSDNSRWSFNLTCPHQTLSFSYWSIGLTLTQHWLIFQQNS